MRAADLAECRGDDRPAPSRRIARWGWWGWLCALLLHACLGALAAAQPEPAGGDGVEALQAPERVEIEPRARDEAIAARLEEILRATGWFEGPSVRVTDGVAFLEGRTESEEYRRWAGDLARKTQDVAAVVNRIELHDQPVWDFEPAVTGLEELRRGLVRALPFLAFGLIVLVVAWLLARGVRLLTRRLLGERLRSQLLRQVVARAAGALVFLVGLYIVFRVSGLTGIAMTVVGGTGLLGLILGIAFRGITENFLASVFLSMQPPFRTGDLVQIGEVTGYVQQLTTRATVLMTFEGDHVQIPNARVYSDVIRNFTSNPNRRASFTVGIGYDDSISEAQAIAMRVLAEHPAVLADPEPSVLVEALGASTVNLGVYFWLDGSKHSWLKTKSSVIRLVKRAFQSEGISMPDEARELIFPQGVPVVLRREADGVEPATPGPRREPPADESDPVSTHSESGLRPEGEEIEEQARRSRTPERGANLLEPGGPQGKET